MNPHPILLVHGIDDSSRRFKAMQVALLAQGLSPVFAMDFIPADASISIEAMACQVQAAVEVLRQAAGGLQVDIVAFSMGAVAARYFLQRLDGRAVVRRFISLAGPHRGTLTAYLRQNVGARQMRPRSALLQNLNAEEDPWGAVEVYSFWSPLDLMVIPSTGSRLPHAHNRVFAVLLHPWILSDKKVITAVVETLASE